MNQRTLILCFFITSAISSFAQKAIRRNIYFETNQSVISAESQNYLRSLSDTIKKYPSYSVELKGHTDADGSNTFNQNLSEKRVKSVKTALESNGILPTNISIAALGETAPVLDNNSEEGKQRNRRVELLITIYPPNSNVVTSSVAKPYENILQLYKDLGQTPQYFKINTARDTTIKGAKGTSIFIPKGAFQGAPSNAIVDFRLKEAYSFADIIAENLTTHSGDKLLQTGGMFYADAVFNNQSLSLKKDLQVTFPTKESKMEGMQLFTGERDMKQNGRIDWKAINNPSQPKQFDDDTLTIYEGSNGFDPYLISDKNGHIKFKDLLDTSNSRPNQLFTRAMDEKNKPILVPKQGITKVGSALAFFMLNNKDYMQKSVLETHKATFKEVYDYYNVKDFEDLKRQNDVSWDSLIDVRFNFMKYGAISKEAYLQKKDSVDKVNARIAREMQQIHEFQKTYALPKLGWINCDRFYNYPQSQLVVIKTPDFKWTWTSSSTLILKKDKLAMSTSSTEFQKVPKNQEAVVVAVKVENGLSYLALHPILTDNIALNLEYKQMSPEEIKEQLKKLDN